MPSISDAEWVVMKVAWEQGQVTANQVVAALAHKQHWKPKTVHTLLRRLTQKGALAYDRVGREFLYRPMVDAEDCAHAVSRSFLKRFFDGQLAPFLASFLEQEELSPEEMAELRRILDQRKS
jgi:BlaI family penicillinase repressor